MEGESFCPGLDGFNAETLVVDSVPVALCWAHQTVAHVKPLNQSKWVTARGKVVSHPATQPCTCKVTWVISPTPEVIKVAAPVPSVTGPSRGDHPALFEDPTMLGDEGLRRLATVTSGE